MAKKNFKKDTELLQGKLKKQILALMEEQGLNAEALALKISKRYDGYSTSRTNMLNKLARASIKYTEAVQIFDVLGYDVKIVPKTQIEQISTTESK